MPDTITVRTNPLWEVTHSPNPVTDTRIRAGRLFENRKPVAIAVSKELLHDLAMAEAGWKKP